MYIEKINSPKDIKKFQIKELTELAGEVREAIINKVSDCGGHLASNLGMVELTIALHYVFDSPKDKFVFDVSHQTYCHKILTGRKDAFIEKESYQNVTGFSNPLESEHDLFAVGHTSTSISLACGLAKARDLRRETENVIAIIGDASLDGGEAFEALNCASEITGNLIVIINDNEMSIPENHGALGKHLKDLRLSAGTLPNNFFKALGFQYLLVEKGNDIEAIIKALNHVKDTKVPVVVHVCTQKGKGFKPAEEDKENWHWARPFDKETGKRKNPDVVENYGNIVAEHLLGKMKENSEIAVIAASTPICIGFNKERRELAGKQYIDVGIAEQNAVTMAAAMAKGGCKPVFATNATFIQRAYDQIQQEMCINSLPATIIVTHASVFGHYNDTHIGILDIPLLANIPNLTYLAPVNKEEYIAMLDWSLEQRKRPVAIRVPWTGVQYSNYDVAKEYDIVSYKIVKEGQGICIMALGGFFDLGVRTAKLLKKTMNIEATVINPRFITGLDKKTLEGIADKHDIVITIEDGILSGGFGSRIAQYYSDKDIKVYNFGFSMDIPKVYNPLTLMEQNSLSESKIIEKIFHNR